MWRTRRVRAALTAVVLLPFIGGGCRQPVADIGTPLHVHAASPRPRLDFDLGTTTTTSTTTTSAAMPRVTVPRATRSARSRVITPPTPSSARTGEPNWAALRQCESGGNYANRRNPRYKGAYQFSYSTWRSVGGSGDPADASPVEQDMRARILYERSGARPWPICGRRL